MGSDAPQFLPIINAAQKRHRRLRRVLADAGFDFHANHQVAREQLGLKILIKVGIGRPTCKPPASKYRRHMARQLAGHQAGKPYGQRAQSENGE